MKLTWGYPAMFTVYEIIALVLIVLGMLASFWWLSVVLLILACAVFCWSFWLLDKWMDDQS